MEIVEIILVIHFILGCVSETNATDGHDLIEYVQPEELFEFYDLSYNSTVKSHHTDMNDTIVQRVHELYTNLTNRFDATERWCVNALGIEEQVCVCACVYAYLK